MYAATLSRWFFSLKICRDFEVFGPDKRAELAQLRPNCGGESANQRKKSRHS